MLLKILNLNLMFQVLHFHQHFKSSRINSSQNRLSCDRSRRYNNFIDVTFEIISTLHAQPLVIDNMTNLDITNVPTALNQNFLIDRLIQTELDLEMINNRPNLDPISTTSRAHQMHTILLVAHINTSHVIIIPL